MSVTGFVESGRVTVGDSLILRTKDNLVAVQVLKIQTLTKELEYFEGGDIEVAIHLTGVERAQLKSGYVLSSD
jgi:selenocysteine-specific translation elongation factor